MAALVVGLLISALGQEALAEEVIERYASDISVARDGTVTVAETIRVRAEGDQIKRGIYRDFPLTFEDESGTVREVGFKLLDVTRDGEPEPHFMQSQGETIRIYAGEEDVFLEQGTYTYVITYETDRQLRWFDDKPELNWNVTGNAWTFPIEGAFAQVTLPDGAAPVRWTAYTGPYGARGTDFSGAVASDGTLSVQTTRPLRPREGLTVVVEIPADAVERPSGMTQARYFLRDYAGWIIGLVGFVAVLGYYAATWHAVGRDPKGGTIIPLFHPPEGVSPALANYIHGWGFGGSGWRAFTAAALSLAVRGLIVFDEKKKNELTLERTGEQPAGGVNALPPGERAIFGWVEGKKNRRAHINQANASSVQSVGKSFRDSITQENRDKFFRRNTLYFVGGVVLTVAVFVAILAFGGLQAGAAMLLFPVGFVGIFLGVFIIPTLRAALTGASVTATISASLSLIAVLGFFVAFGAQFIAAIPGSAGTLFSSILGGLARNPFPLFLVLVFPALNGLFFYLLRAPTALGRPVMDKLEGFRLYLETAESGRLNIVDAPEITTERFEALLPYAVALDVEQPWADAFAAALERAHPDDPDPMHHYRPRWSRGHTWSANFGRSIASTVTGATSALAASTPRSSSSSSGFSGGGGSGGGGGGGGGGGW